MREYYIVKKNEQKGPYSLDEIISSNVKPHTLIWHEGMQDWEKAENVEELKVLFKSMPPPTPKQAKSKVYKVEAEITKKNEHRIKPETAIKTAKEIKVNFKLVMVALIIGAAYFPFHFGLEKGFKHMNIKAQWEKLFTDENIDEYSRAKKTQHLTYESGYLGYQKAKHRSLTNYHEGEIERAVENSIEQSIFIAIISSLLLILGRYFYKVVKWIEDTSKKGENK